MMISTELATSVVAAVKSQLDGGFLYIYAGAVPADVEDALDTQNVHTLLAKVSLNGDGVTGLTWDAAANRAITKPSGADWEATAAFSGFEDSESELLATFARLVPAAQDPEVGTSTPRAQFVVSGPGGFGEVVLASQLVTNSGAVVINAAWINA